MNTKAANCCKTISVYNNLLHSKFVKCKLVQYRLQQSYSVYKHQRYKQLQAPNHIVGRCRSAVSTTVCSASSVAEPHYKVGVTESPAPDDDVFAAQQTRVKRRPFVKEFFTGRVDTDVLAYPEILKRAKLTNLNEYAVRIKPLFQLEGDVEGDELRGLVREQRLWGVGVPKAGYGGIELNATQAVRVCEEFYADRNLGALLIAHTASCEACLVPEAEKSVKDKYLPLAATGECILAPLLFDPVSVEGISSDDNKAKLSDDEKTYFLTGSKRIIKYKLKPDAYVVFMKSEVTDERTGLVIDELSGFLVDSNSTGISIKETPKQEGFYGDEFQIVEFNETPVPVTNVIGKPGKALPVLLNLLGKIRLYSSAMNTGLLRGFMGWCMEELSKSDNGKLPTGGVNELVTRVLGQISTKLYAMESMIHFTAGLIDTKEQDDTSMEEAMCKLFSSEESWRSIDEALHVLTLVAPVSSLPTYEKFYKDARAGLFHEEGNEQLRSYIYVSALRYYGDAMRDEIMKLRNPLYHPWETLKWTLKYRKSMKDNPKLDLKLYHHLHPSLKKQSDTIEYGIKHLEWASRLMLVRWGSELTDKMLEGRRLANASTSMFAAVVAIAHANRSYCIGLRNADLEMGLARNLIIDSNRLVKRDIVTIINGGPLNTDDLMRKVVTRTLKHKKYVAAHPLSHNPE